MGSKEAELGGALLLFLPSRLAVVRVYLDACERRPFVTVRVEGEGEE